jgi:PII-like signaling protein
VNDDGLKLTIYFGERDRVGRRFLADALIDVYAHARVATSVLLRGVEGFGPRHHRQTARLLTLSEDLPLVSVAVDDRARIEALLPAVRALRPPGLVTLERARLLTGDLLPVTLPEELHEATKLTIYLGRQERVYRMPAFAAVCDLLYRREVAGATALLGVDGTAHGARRRARFFGRNAAVPLMLISVGEGDRIARVLPELGGLLRRPLVTLERVRVCKRDGELLAEPRALPATDERGLPLWQKLMVYTSARARHRGRPLHVALLERLRAAGGQGATVLRGFWGFHGADPPHGDRLLQLQRHVPTVTVVVAPPPAVPAVFAVVDELTAGTGLVTSEMVPAVATRPELEGDGALRLAEHAF